ncbi:putative transcription factor interactor and regulator CCHC(Zn) family [Helianthus annuus]|uniref:Transcription factor interactor and regulator CCHC(Zn) family n=1 Tax=Helianthus annuus TaxID=4232 RepID=A0A9K3HNE8_HELAN|nr:putative transcription factor interactor and regulator CCHC(Zn) family [Helianthus annuus]
MNSSTHQQDIKLYYKGNVQTAEASPKIQTAFSAGNQSPPSSQESVNTSGFSTVNPPSAQNTSVGNGYLLQCNVALHLQNGQNYTEEIVKSHMWLLVTALESYEGLIAGRIGNPMLTKEDYDQIDAEELELMDIKWALASVLRRAEKFRLITGRTDFLDANLSNLGFDKSKVVCFRCREKGHFKRECKNQQPRGEKESSGKDDYYRKTIYQQITHQPHQQKEPQTAHGRMIEDANRKAYYGIIDQDDEKMAKGFSWDKFIPADSNVKAFIAHIIRKPEMLKEWMEVLSDEEKSEDKGSVSSENSSSETSDSDEEIEQINIGKTHLSSDSFEFYFAEKLKKLKEKKAAKEMKEVKVIEKIVEVEKRVEVEKIVEVTKPCLTCLESCKQCIEKDERLSELEKLKEQLLFDVKNLKRSYDVLNRHVNSLEKTNSEREKALKMLNATMMTKQKEINMYIVECAKLKKELDSEAAENERIRRLLQSYKGCDYIIDRIYPTVEGFEAFKDEQPKKRKDTGKKQGVCYNKCPPPIWEGYSPRKPNEEELTQAVNIKLESEITDVLPDNIDVTFTASDTDHESELIKRVVDQVLDKDEESESKSESESSFQSVGSSSSSDKSSKSSGKRAYSKEFLLSKSNLNDETFEVAYTLNGSDKLYFDKEFPIRGVKPEMIKKVFKLT